MMRNNNSNIRSRNPGGQPRKQRISEKNENGPSEYDGKKKRRKSRHWLRICMILTVGVSTLLLILLVIQCSGFVKGHKSFLRASERTVMIPKYYRPTADSRRFPKFGTPEFAQQCSWAVLPTQTDSDCTFMVFPTPKHSEGIADWISSAACSYTSAKQTGCKFLMDYGPKVDLDQMLSKPFVNWTIPRGTKNICPDKCEIHPITHKSTDEHMHEIEGRIGRKVVRIPHYRHAYDKKPYLYKNMFPDLERGLSGFDVETGMACSLGALFELSPRAAQFEPDLFTKILPTLHDENALVMAIYYRFGQTDIAARAQKNGTVAKEVELTDEDTQWLSHSLNCALSLEETYLSSGYDGFPFGQIVWLVITDSVHIKERVKKSYDSHDANERVSVEKRKWKDQTIPREIVTTSAQGRHSKQELNPSTADFADALIDWFLIGESDLVIINNAWYSYGATGALRTARPLYLARTCERLTLVHDHALPA